MVHEYAYAIECFEQALVYAKRAKERECEVAALGGLGNLYLNTHDTRAMEYLAQAGSLAHDLDDYENEVKVLQQMAELWNRAGNADRAFQCLERASNILLSMKRPDMSRAGRLFGDMGITFVQAGQNDAAIFCYEKALDYAGRARDTENESTVSWNYGQLLEEKGQLTRAAELMQVRVDYERKMGLPEATMHALRVDELRRMT